jgi:hypothetical protein
VEIFSLVTVATIAGFKTIFQARANVRLASPRQRITFVLMFAAAASLVRALIDGPLLNRVNLRAQEGGRILALQALAAASFAGVMSFGIGRWGFLPRFAFFVILGNTSSVVRWRPRSSRSRSRSSPSGFPPTLP